VSVLDAPLRSLVGGGTAKALAEGLDLHTVGDLLRHYPRRYAERGELTDLGSLRIGEQVTVLAEVASVNWRPMRNRRGNMLEVVVTDGRGILNLTFFNPKYQWRDLRVGRRGLFAGKVSAFRRMRQLTHPDYQLLSDRDDQASEADAADFLGALIPVYPATKALASWKIGQCVRVVLDTLGQLDDPLPVEVRRQRGLVDMATAFRLVHRPESRGDVRRAHRRLKYDEAFVLQVVLAQRRVAARAEPATPRLPAPDGLLAEFDRRLPFELTGGQREVGRAVADELARDHPMQRLLQGEVGTGKTVVAMRAMLAVVDAGGQAAMLAPTEVLAQQHHRSIIELMGPLADGGRLGGAERATQVALLTGSQGAAARREALLDVASGTAGIVVGTHALLEDPVQFFDLGLVVIDEQHRFGVEQRDALRSKAGTPPHMLVMTATPIPRTVAMTVFGDLEVSTLRELPRGRASIATHVVPAGEKPHFLERAWQRIREEVEAGHQAYIVCPRIGDGDADDATGSDGDGTAAAIALADDDALAHEDALAADTPARRPPLAVLDVAPMLADGPLAGLSVGILHGRLPPDQKDAAMRRFVTGDIDVLVATTVVEVGVDVPNATAMVVLDADRFGVSQLHQLRGRVGRGSAPGLCLLVTDTPPESPARERLDAVAATLDGFELSRVDLEQRREGDVLGASQSGRRSSLRLLAVIRDEDVIRDARDDATALVEADPKLRRHPALADDVAALLDDERAGYLEKT
jgi:ATP-dependent DNA helicase RecG